MHRPLRRRLQHKNREIVGVKARAVLDVYREAGVKLIEAKGQTKIVPHICELGQLGLAPP